MRYRGVASHAHGVLSRLPVAYNIKHHIITRLDAHSFKHNAMV